MERLYFLKRTWHSEIFTFIISLLSIYSASGQQGPKVEEGLIRVQVTESLAAQIEHAKMTKGADGIMLTGITSIDEFSRLYNVKEIKRLFRAGGKFEARHRKHGLHRWYQIRMDQPGSVLKAVSSYQSLINIQKAEPVYQKALVGSNNENFHPVIVKESALVKRMALPSAPNDPMLANQWHYNNTGQTGGTPGADISLFDAWKSETGKSQVIVAITDGGIQTDHPDLAANMWTNAAEVPDNNLDDDNNGFIDDIHGYSFVDDTGLIAGDNHGTHVAGTIAAVTNNAIGVAGVAGGSGNNDGVRLMSCAVFSDYGADGFPESYIYAADNGAIISQNSWNYTYPGVFEQAVLDAIDYFIEEAGKDENGNQVGLMKGGLVVFSSGNSNSNENYYPSYYAPTFSVAATTHQDTKSWYSNYGTWVDVSAPGGETDLDELQGVLSTMANSQYGYFMGTSMACPHVSGVAALVLSKYGKAGFGPQTLRDRLRYTTDAIDAVNPAYPGMLGTGRVNAAMALNDDDNTAPEAVADLAVSESLIGKVTLSWTAPPDYGGFVAFYDVRYSTSPITAANFSTAIPAGKPSAAQPSGNQESFTVTGLAGGTLYYFSIKAIDFQGNASAVSNIISKTTELAPVILVSPSSLIKALQTAEKATSSFSIQNTGPGHLEFTITNAALQNDYAACSPHQGNVAPGGSQLITVQFNAENLLEGIYEKNVIIETNDPEAPTVTVSITLQVSNNNAPIASISENSINFKSVQVGDSSIRQITIHNAGSEILNIEQVTSSNENFITDFSGPVNIPAFEDLVLKIIFIPQITGIITADLSIKTNDPANTEVSINLNGEGLDLSPVAIEPAIIRESLARGTTSSTTFALHNNGSYDRAFKLETISKGLTIEGGEQSHKSSKMISNNGRQSGSKAQKEYLKSVSASAKANALLQPLQSDQKTTRKGASGRIAASQMNGNYKTGFEEFTTGSINEQQNWFAMDGWTVTKDRPSEGVQHLRGTASQPGQETFAISPRIIESEEEYPPYSYTSMRINLDNSRGGAWQVVPQDPWNFVVTRIRFSDSGIIDIMSVDENYETHWTQIDMEFPLGYFDLAITHNLMGDGTSGFPVFEVFIDNKKVFHGYSLAGIVGEVAFMSLATIAGPTFDIDELEIIRGEYVPEHVKLSPASGNIPAGGSTTVTMNIDATDLNFGSYRTDIIAVIDEADQLTIPASVVVTGEGSMTTEPGILYTEGYKEDPIIMELKISNTGGTPIEFELFKDLPGLTLTPSSGTIPLRGQANISVVFNGSNFDPGIFNDSIKIVTNLETNPFAYIPVKITVWEELAFFSAPSEVNIQVVQGEISTTTFQISNQGENSIAFETNRYSSSNLYTLDPPTGTLGDQPLDITITFDGRFLEEGQGRQHINFFTNDVAHYYVPIPLNYEILPNRDNGSGKIQREEWTGIAGKTIASIPVDDPPSSITEVTELAGPYGHGDNYGARIRGYIQAPQTGYYTFYIASDDHSELWLSLDTTADNKVKIAYLNNFVNPGQFSVYPSQHSGLIYLEGNHKYYIEVLHKEGTGRDHLTVGWELPSGRQETPIPGFRLFPLNYSESENQKPVINLVSPVDGQIFQAPTSIAIEAEAFDSDGDIVKVEFYSNANKLGVDYSTPYRFNWNHVAAGNYTVVARAFDDNGATDSAVVNIVLQGQQVCTGVGTIQREVWTSIPGIHVSSIPVNSPPSLISDLTTFEAPGNFGDNYGTRIRGYLCIPETGDYTFWIASDDHSELWLSTNESPANKVKIASVTGHTRRGQWDKYASQKSVAIRLIAGNRYYIEALHKEATGTDHLAVGWQLPDGALERPITGNRLIPFTAVSGPSVSITSPVNGQQFDSPAAIIIQADANDTDGTIAKVKFYQNNTLLGEDTTIPYSFSWNNVAPGNYTLMAKAFDYGGNSNSSSVNIIVNHACTGTGTILQEVWWNIAGSSVADIPVDTNPGGVNSLNTFESPSYYDNNYGARLSGYICVPQTGPYTFWIASDDNGELWLSADNDPNNKIKIASVPGHTYSRQWEKYPSQKSVTINLEAGHQYYIEALHKEATGNDHVAVGWQLPDATLERPIPGNRLTPFDRNTGSAVARAIQANHTTMLDNEAVKTDIRLFPNPVSQGKVTLSIPGNNAELRNKVTVEIINSTGNIVYSEVSECEADCDISIEPNARFVPGVYIVKAVVNGQEYSKRLVIY